jgi:chromosomal replication initiator protein
MSAETVLSLWKGPIPLRRTMASILAEVSEETGITVAEFKSDARFRKIAWPRQYAMWRMVEEGCWSLTQIGNFFGGRDHTTVLHGWRQVEKRNAKARAA